MNSQIAQPVLTWESQLTLVEFSPLSSTYHLQTTYSLRLTRQSELVSNRVQKTLICKSANPKIWVEGQGVDLQLRYNSFNFPELPLSLDNYWTLYQDPTEIKIILTQDAKVLDSQFKLVVKIIHGYKQIEGIPIFAQPCPHKIIGTVPMEPQEIEEFWMDKQGVKKRKVTYDWQVFFSGNFQEQVQLEKNRRAFVYNVGASSDPQAIGFIIGKFKFQKFNVNLKDTGKLLQVILIANRYISHSQLIYLFNNYIYELISILNKLKLFKTSTITVFIHDLQHPPLENLIVLPSFFTYPTLPPTAPPALKFMLRGLLVPFFSQDWLIQGFSSYIQLTLRNPMWKRAFHVEWEKLMKDISYGLEDINLGVSDRRSLIIIHMLSQITHQSKLGLCEGLIGYSLKQNIRISADRMFKIIKNMYGIKSLKYFSEQFIKSTGATKLRHKFQYTKKENKIVVKVFQRALQHRHLFGRNLLHIALLNHFGLQSQLMNKIKSRNKEMTCYGAIAVPLSLKSFPFLKAQVKLMIAQTNQQQYKQDQYSILIDRKPSSVQYINYRSKLKKNIQKKEKPGQEHPKFDSAYSQMPNKLPGWLKIDPERSFMFNLDLDYDFEKGSNAQYIMLIQLSKQKKEFQLFKIIQKAKKFKSHSVVEALINMLDLRETNLVPKQVRIEIVQALPSMCSQRDQKIQKFLMDLAQALFINKEAVIPNYFLNIEMYQFKLGVLRALMKIKVQESQPAKFDLSAGMTFCSVFPTRPREDQIVSFFFKLFKDNNNTYNKKNDAEYKALLIEGLLKYPKSKFCLMVTQQMLKQIQVQACQPSFGMLVGLKIAQQILPYIENSLLLPQEKQQMRLKVRQKIEALTRIESLLGGIRIWSALFRSQTKIIQSKMRHKEFIIYIYEKLNKLQLESDSGRYLEALRAVASILQSHSSKFAANKQFQNRSQKLMDKKEQDNLLITDQKYCFKMQVQLPIEQAYIICQLLWDKLVHAQHAFRNQWIRIWKAIYFYFTPPVVIAYHKKYPDIIRRRLNSDVNSDQLISALFKDFDPDPRWMAAVMLPQKVPQKQVPQNQSKVKKTKTDEQMPLVADCSAMQSFVQKNPDRINWIELSKTILDNLLHMYPEVQQLTAPNQPKQKNPLTLRSIRKKLKKGCIPKGYSMDQVEEDILSVVIGCGIDTIPIIEKFKNARKVLSTKEKLSCNIKDCDTKIVLPLK